MSEGKLNLGRPNKYIDLNFEEISCDRVITDGNFANGLQNFRFSVAPSGGGCILPHMSYFMVEYNFGSAEGTTDPYTAVNALNQNAKVALQNNFMSCMYNACRFTIAQSEISVVNSSHAQAHTLMRRMGLTTDFIEDIGPELTGFDPDFSRRLAKTCADGVFHRDGLIDCSPYNSVPLSPESLTQIPLVFQNKEVLTRTITADGKYRYYNGSGQNISITPDANNIFPFMSKFAEFNLADGQGAIKTGDPGNTGVRSIQWSLPAFSFLPGSPAQNAVVIDGTVILEGDDVVFYWGQDSKLNGVTFRVTETKANVNQQTLILSVEDGLVDKADMLAVMVASPVLLSGIISVKRPGSSLVQADPRSNIVNQQVIYQPPLAFFKMEQPDVFFGDMEIQMTPNANWRQAAIESSTGGFYNVDKKHGTDYAFGIKSMRLYLARARLVAVPDNRVAFTIPDIQVANKQLPNGSSVINFNIPPSTQKVVVWIQDSAVGTHSMLPLTRFKTRQYTSAGLNNLDRYGPWAHTYDEKLTSLQLNFAGITKPVTNFQRGGYGEVKDANTNNMLQRWIMTNQNNNNRKNPEKYHDWLSMGAYYLFDFTRSSDNLGTYLTVSVKYDGDQPSAGNSLGDGTPSNVNLYVAAIYERDVALTYGEYGNVVSAATQMR